MNYIKQQLKHNLISRREFAKIIGLDHSHFNKLLNQQYKPMYKTIFLIAKGLERLDNQNWVIHAKAISSEISND